MLEFLNPAPRQPVGSLTNVTAADKFWQLLPRDDPLAAQRAVSDALAAMVAQTHFRLPQFRALLALDQLVRPLADSLLADCAAAPGLSLQTNAWQSAHELCRSFGRAFDHALRHIVDGEVSRGWLEYAPTVLLRLFQHRQLEFLLQPYTGEHSIPDCWIGLHMAFRYAEAAGLQSEPLVAKHSHEGRGEQSTFEREYIHVLLMQMLNDGRLSPFEALWLNRQISGWCAVLSLQADRPGAAVEPADNRFVIDLDGATGLARPSRSAAGMCRYLDPAPMLALISDEIAALSDPSRPVDRSSPFQRGRLLKLLRAVRAICQPRPEPVNRRGKRLPVASAVEAIVGLSQIARALRHEDRRGAAGMAAGLDGADERLQLKDRSESGCRLRGRIGNSSRVLPGALVAFRERSDIPWTLAVVRRSRKRIGDRIDIGVEYLGQNPLVVGLVADDDRPGNSSASSSDKRAHCVALYLVASPLHPKLPFATLILPPQEFKAGRCLTLRSDGAQQTVRLKEPIEEQEDFVWLPYEAVSGPATDASRTIADFRDWRRQTSTKG